MASKISIALIGATEKKGIEIYHRIANNNSRFLLVSGETEKLETLVKEYSISHPHTVTEITHCVKNSCWEADIIIIAVCVSDEEETLRYMKEVCTQKIVVTLLEKTERVTDLYQKLPFSKLVNVDLIHTEEIFIEGKDEEAVNEIRTIFSPALSKIKYK